VHDLLFAAGRDLGIGHAGHMCVDACRVEKGFLHWSHDIGPDDTPFEAGLSFAVAMDKDTDFIGRDALLRQREMGLRRRLVTFAVDEGHPLLLHDEPIFRDGRRVGHTTSGARGFRTGRSLAMGYVACEPGETKSDLLSGAYEIEVAGTRQAVTALAQAAYDPGGTRMRG